MCIDLIKTGKANGHVDRHKALNYINNNIIFSFNIESDTHTA